MFDNERWRYFVTTCMSQRKSAEVEGAIFPRLLATDIVESINNQITRKKSGPENLNTSSESAGYLPSSGHLPAVAAC